MRKKVNIIKKKLKRSKNWLKIWEKKGGDLRNSKIKKIIATNGHNSILGTFSKDNWYRYIKSIFSKIKLKKNSEILEYGCGAGAFLSFFNDGNYKLYGIDYSKSLILKAKKYFNKIQFQCGQISKIDFFDKKFDLIFSHSVFHYFDNYDYANLLIKKMLINLKDNGCICILDVPDKEKEQIYKKRLINEIGPEDYKKKYRNYTHLFYKKSFFRAFAKKNDLKIKIFNQSFKSYENAKYRYNVIFKKNIR